MNKLLKAALSQYEAERDEALAVLDIYLNKSVGIADHSGLLKEVGAWTRKLTDAEENIETLNRHFL